jgi:uncharacterized protein YjaZ
MQHDFIYQDKCLTVFAKNLYSSANVNDDLIMLIQPIFDELAPFIKKYQQVIYLRDIKAYSIDQKYPGGHTYIPTEIQIAVPQWPAETAQLQASIAHEMHHLARWQNPGYGKTLGEAVVSEGIAMYFEELRSGWTPPWANGKLKSSEYRKAIHEWHKEDYDHSDWFYDGSHGKWAGYTLGYKIAKDVIFKDGFDLRSSIEEDFSSNRKLLVWLERSSTLETPPKKDS